MDRDGFTVWGKIYDRVALKQADLAEFPEAGLKLLRLREPAH